jgi:hypothetical protein
VDGKKVNQYNAKKKNPKTNPQIVTNLKYYIMQSSGLNHG